MRGLLDCIMQLHATLTCLSFTLMPCGGSRCIDRILTCSPLHPKKVKLIKRCESEHFANICRVFCHALEISLATADRPKGQEVDERLPHVWRQLSEEQPHCADRAHALPTHCTGAFWPLLPHAHCHAVPCKPIGIMACCLLVPLCQGSPRLKASLR